MSVAAASIVAGVSACGDPITASHTWYGLASASTYLSSLQQPVGQPIKVLHNVLSGHLVDAQGTEVPGTAFVEDCTSFVVPPAPSNPQGRQCTLLLDTGPKFYAARGMTTENNNYGQLGSLGPGGIFGGGVINVQLLKTEPLGKYLLLLSAVKA